VNAGDSERRFPTPLAALLLLLGIVSLPFAWAIWFVACDSPGSQACDRYELATGQLFVALGGVVALAVLAFDAARRRRRAYFWLAAAIGLFLTWGLLADAAVHGWDELKLVPG
jgi:hypothetical protein